MNRTAFVVVAATMCTVAACSGGDDVGTGTIVSAATTTTPPSTELSVETSTTLEQATTTTVESTTTTTMPEVWRMPLTGELIDGPEAIPDRPALAVKITNAGPQPTPQAGLNAADLVIEEVINDQVSRLAAVFHSRSSDPVGPVRSGRAQDINVLLALDRPLFAWSGGNVSVTDAIQASDLVDLDARTAPGFYRRPSRPSPNNLYSSTDVLWSQATDQNGRPSPVFSYLAPGEAPQGDPATRIDLVFDQIMVRWTYDAETGRYRRSQNGAEHNTEEGSKVERVSADNVVVMLADYGVNVFDGNPEAQVLGSNRVLVFSGGTVRQGVWLRFAPTDPFGLFVDVDNSQEIGLVPGRTWLEIPRNIDGTVSFE